ncbi:MULTISPECIES: DNA repair protein RecO [Dyadobacter]|jgi:DNA repair protein RecO (recombination protein O)|uniref:DNA repair protein RecO n=1 Tax=Dyadobacter chenhuakuii TaxID=2909339 RepID=A0A9X1QGL6_9BACT|nr:MULTISPECIES: DNA repair protein RecO [Dyadobacter]MCF2495577.1 DNA repair protein RecO [Dyadobacter chenhuakuii]MCF2499952.1 DNA repair protein RecO [Dyadobacter chenhuakuii]MCF2520194.1 DNA repair protein RecO [Dyadobacter sp. CY351]USJ29613.1 DNA repair protein RecO [Dyadobacter chenhuakuii]
MLHKTRGVALSYIRYRESSIIAKIYTEGFGIQTYIVNGVRSSKSRNNRIALFQPLTLLDMVVYHKNKEDTMHRISEMKCYMPFQTLPYDVVKSSLALFVTEMLGKTLKEEESNPMLFHFIEESVLFLDEAENTFENFHIQFLIQFASFLGFGIETVEDLESELKNNHFPHMPDAVERDATLRLVSGAYGANVPLDRKRRIMILEKLIFFFKIHMEALGEIKSLEVLREVLK